MSQIILETTIDRFPRRSGKVRDIYDLGDQLLIVASDRLSAFDVILPNGVPEKGRVLTLDRDAAGRALEAAQQRAAAAVPALDPERRTADDFVPLCLPVQAPAD